MNEMNEINDLTLACELEKLDLLLEGRVDFVEAGDCRIPGLPESLRASLSGDEEKPILIYGAGVAPKPESPDMIKMTKIEAMSALVARKVEIAKKMGPVSKIFTVKLRKQYSW